jgi:hypothetical protein
MKGIIQLISPKQAMVGVETESGGYSVLELLGGYIFEVGDVLSGPLEELGDQEVRNLTQEETWDVYIQDILGSRQVAWNMISKF